MFVFGFFHDTGLWSKKYFQPVHNEFLKTLHGRWIKEDLFAHQCDEQIFVNWIRDEFPDYGMLHLHSINKIRDGITLIQVHFPLE